MSVEAGYAAWLKGPALYVLATSPALTGRFPNLTVDAEVISPLALVADAQAEADYQEAFLAGPLVRDRLTVLGLRSDLIGKLITAKGDRLGYEGAGTLAFVVAAAEQEGAKVTILSVIKRLGQ